MKLFIRLLPGIAWFFIILYLLTIPGKQLPQADWMDSLHIDKLVHISLFCMLTLLFFWGIVSTKPGIYNRSLLFLIAALGLAYGIAMEFVQKYWIPNRSFDIWDIVADGAGSFVPLLFIGLLVKQLHLQLHRDS